MKTLLSLVLVVCQVLVAFPVSAQSQPVGSVSPTVKRPCPVLRNGPIFQGVLHEAARLAAESYGEAARQPMVAGQGNPGAKKSKKAELALAVTGIALAAAGTYLVATWKTESSGSPMNCPTPRCTPGQLCPTYCYSDYQYNGHSGRLTAGVALLGAGAVAVVAAIGRWH